ncbi:metal transporter [Shewanella sp. NFH-SH190041]|uniref:metal transporter n=1 Tax=Shewanella sp. NFH-SH190041 TaxID=2950245 RepID=UPI0021C4903C|nr:metal transporter [Shewanella sp. NFH-SH190041]BDM62583.1 metal transporter [Shewanella sp. NFH-SH190041]
MLYLVASCIALLLGPLFYRYFSSGSGLQKGLDGFIFVSLGGLVLVHILPELLHHGGFLAIIFVILGLWGPTASERLFHRYSDITHNLTLALGIGGLMLHTLTDGGAMVLAQQDGNSSLLALGVILHRLPVGLAIWWLLKPQVGTKWAALVLFGMMLLTAVGYFASGQLLSQLSLDNTVYLQAFVTGSILHVVLHQPHGHPNADKQGKYEYQAGIGSLLGIVLLVLLLALDSGEHHHEGHEHSTDQLAEWLILAAPALLLAYITAVIRFAAGLKPAGNMVSQWIQRLAGPEAILVTLLLLGPGYALLQFGGLLIVGAYLCYSNIQPVEHHTYQGNSALQFGFSQLVDRSAPWILFSLILANLIGHPSVPLSNPLLQIIVLLVVFISARFCPLGGVILAMALAVSGWHSAAVMLALLAAPVFNRTQLKLMSWGQRISLLIMLLALVWLSTALVNPIMQPLLALPLSVNYACLAVIALLFAASLLRLGPRKFLKHLMLIKVLPQHEHHAHGHEHNHGHHH